MMEALVPRWSIQQQGYGLPVGCSGYAIVVLGGPGYGAVDHQVAEAQQQDRNQSLKNYIKN